MTAGVNASSTIGLGALALYSQQLSIPPASASIGGTYGISLAIPISPLIGPVVHGINAALIPLAGANIE